MELSDYLAEIGRRGGRKSRRKLDSKTARDMVRLREARKAFHRFYAQCFWSYDPKLKISLQDIPWIAKQLMTYGGHKAWFLGAKLCH